MKNVLVFSDEYSHTSRGLFTMFMQQALGISANYNIILSVNKDHWGAKELSGLIEGLPNLSVRTLPISHVGKSVLSNIQEAKRQSIRLYWQTVLSALNTISIPWVIYKLWKWLSDQKLDLIIIHNGGFPGGFLSRWLAVTSKFFFKIPTIEVIHNYPASNALRALGVFLKPIRFLQIQLHNASVNCTVAVSDSLNRSLSNFGIKNVSTIHNSYDSVVEEIHEFYPSKDAKFTVICVAALVPRKGVNVLLEAVAVIEYPIRIVVIGDGPLKQKYENLAAELGIDVSFLEYSNEAVHTELSKSDVAVVPSVAFESFGIVALEAMSHGIPVVASDTGGLPEVVVDRKTGLVFRSGDSQDLADKISTLISNPELRVQLGVAGYHSLKIRFSAKRMADEYNQLIETQIVFQQTI